MSKPFNVFAIILLVCLQQALIGQPAPNRYILFLEDAPAVERFATQDQAQSLAARNYRQQVEAKQQVLKTDLAARGIQVTGSVSTLLNAIFVAAPAERVDELKSLPGVRGVVAQRRYRLNLNRATQLVNATAAWTALGGTQSAGAGIKIAMLDTGIDQTHPAFQDSSLKAPTGYPICAGSDCNFTNNKVIVARSYVRQLAAGSDPTNPAVDSTPDDYSARDRSGHGTATASAAAGAPNTAPNGLTLTGVAPKAFLGNYKVFGSPLVNDFASDAVLVQALEDAINDRMDIASMSLGQAALTGPLDTGAVCGKASGVPCDVLATAVENAIKRGMLVVIAAGNDGDGNASYNTPTLSSIETPGNAPSAIAVGATTSSHFMIEGVQVPGSDVPSNLRQVEGALGDGPFPNGALSAPLQDVTRLGDDGLACSALPAGSLNGVFVLIQRGTCSFLIKVNNAQNAGAAGVILYMADQSSLVSPGNLGSTSVPAIMISNSDGVALKSFIDANAGRAVVIDPFAIEQTKSASNLLASFSSLGPTTGDNAIKPDLVATGGSSDFFSDMYLAAESYDSLGDFYSANRYAAGSGTSFATPLVAGAAALVKQAHPSFSPAQIKSALVNTTSQDVTSDEPGAKVGVQQIGAGKLDAAAAIQTTITANPATISFGVPATLPITKQLQINNAGSSSANLSLAVTGSTTGVTVTVDQASITLAGGASATVRVTLSGALPAAGSYSGFVTIQNGSSTLRVPYLFLVGSGVVDNLIVVGFPSDTGVGQDAGQFAVKLIDAFGVPVSGADVQFSSRNGTLQKAESKTNAYGIATAEAILGSQPGSYSYSVTAAGMTLGVSATAIPQPIISDGGVLNAASFEKGKPVAPGSYVSIFGTSLSTVTRGATTAILPLVISGVTVSFDVPSAKISVPGHLVYVSPNQVNLQVPWELQGQTSAQVKVTFGDGFGFGFGNVVTVPLSDYTPAFFEIGGGNVAARDVKGGVIGTGNPAQRGQVVQLYANGLGPVSNQPASGDPAPSSPLANCRSTPTVTIGTQPASVGFCGLAPTFPGLYQLNVTVPSTLSPGTYPITVAIGGQTSKTSNIIVQ
jgi:minor extracellular serine protease Vpr